jgi:RecB family exonuclease
MKDYSIPETDGLTPEQAAQALNAFRAAGRADREHPYFTRGHPQHAEFVDYVRRLDEIKHSGAVEAERQAQTAALSDGLAEAEAGIDVYAPPEEQIKALEAIPGFMSGELRQSDRPRHNRIQAARDALYAKVYPEKSDEADDEQTDDAGSH